MHTTICSDLGRQAADFCGRVLKEALANQNTVNIILATGTSQIDFLQQFVQIDIDWSRIVCFHLDEYVNLSPDHPASFRHYLQSRVWSKVTFKDVHPLDPDHIEEYESLIAATAIDLACIGIGENGHIAFNDPPVANFRDPVLVKTVELDEACRQQQVVTSYSTRVDVNDKHVAAIMNARCISVVVPESRKAVAVLASLIGPIAETCPASVLRRHDNTHLWLDTHSAELYRMNEDDVIRGELIDLQVNGYMGVNCSSQSLTKQQFKFACDAILKTGVRMFLPTLISSSMETYEHVLPLIANFLNDNPMYKTFIPGIHLEGPFLSPEDGARGCHSKQNIITPNTDTFSKLYSLANRHIKLVTIAADQPGAVDLCRFIRQHDVIVSLGHHLATAADLRACRDEGATVLTHLGNGLPTLMHRHNNPLIAGLAVDGLTAAIITDGHHLSPELIKVIIKVKGKDNVIVTSDVTSQGGMPAGEYEGFDGQRVTLSKDGRLKVKGQELLAGSASSLRMCRDHLTSLGYDSDTISKLFSTNPRKILNLPTT